MESSLNVIRESDHWVFELNRPDKRNALSEALIESLITAVDEAHDADIPLLVFKGAGKNFSAGFDFGGFEESSEGDLLLRMVRIEMLLQKVAASPSLTVGLAHGRNFGAGVDLFAACKLRYATPDATFRMPGLKFGLVLGTRRFRNLVGVDAATSILGSARSFDAPEARDMGFLTQTAAEDEWPGLLEQARQKALALDATTRRALYRALDINDADTDLAELVRSAARPGFKARIRAYLGA